MKQRSQTVEDTRDSNGSVRIHYSRRVLVIQVLSYDGAFQATNKMDVTLLTTENCRWGNVRFWCY